MARYKNLGGTHQLEDGTVIVHGQIFESDADPRKSFQNKFELQEAKTATVAPVAPPVEPDEPVADGPVAPAPVDALANATNVTGDFPTAGKNELVVKKDKTGYWILDDNDPVNEKALRTKKAVETAIAEYVKG